VNGEQNWPRYALITHAIELALKGFALQHSNVGKVPGDPKRHDLMGWYQAAIAFGLKCEPGMTENIAALNYLHESHYMRYPKPERAAPNPGSDC
jgi:hypothetical protein